MRSQTLVATLECAGNGRSTFDPPVDGEQWQLGAVSTAEWTGVPLVEVLDRAGAQRDAREVVFRGADRGDGRGGRPTPIPFERSLSLDDARSSEALLAYAMNGEPLPVQHGYPLRLIVPGLVRGDVGQVADRDRGHRPRRSTAFFQTERYVFEWERDDGRPSGSRSASSRSGR